MRVLITGANGQLGQDLVRVLSTEYKVYAFGRDKLDVTNLSQVEDVMECVQPDVVIHAAAYTAVDRAETESDNAYRVNAFGSRNVAVVAERVGAKVCYISTDYVFDGQSSVPYREFDSTNPQSVYGKSKSAGEHLIQTFASRHFIVRTSWVYGAAGKNFVKTMLKLSNQQTQIRVVDDQIGSPTYTLDLAVFLGQLIHTDRYGVYHVSNTGTCSWFEFAKAIFEESHIGIAVEPCCTEEFPQVAPRPRYSALDHLAIRANGFQPLRDWREALRDCLVELNQLEMYNAYLTIAN